MVLLNPCGSEEEGAGEVRGGRVVGGDGGGDANCDLGASSKRTNLDVSVVVAGSNVGKFEKPLKLVNGLAGGGGAGVGGLENPTGSLGLNGSCSTSNSSSSSKISSSKISSGCGV